MKPEPPPAVTLTGPDPANPLGHLATLGAFALAARRHPGVTLHWTPTDTGPRPVLGSAAADPDQLAADLLDVIDEDHAGAPPRWAAEDVIKRPRAEFAALAVDCAALATPADRSAADLASAFASEAVTEDKTDRVEPHALSFANGQSGKLLLRDVRDLAAGITAEKLAEALYQPWVNHDDCKTLRWDPADRRLYAHRAGDPGTATTFGSRGGNLLGFYGLSLLPVFPTLVGLASTGLRRHRPADAPHHVALTWGLWSTPSTLDTTRSLVNLPELQELHPNPDALRARGFTAAFRSRKVEYQKGLYLSPATSLF